MVARRHRQRLRACCFWGAHTGPNPTDRGKKGCKRHLITDAQGIPLVVHTTPANVHDSQPAIELLDRIPAIQGPRGRPRRRPDAFQGDRAYGSSQNVAATKARRVKSLLAKPRTTHSSGLGKFRYVVERSLAWFGHKRRLKVCYEKNGEHFQAFHDLTAALICANKLDALEIRF